MKLTEPQCFKCKNYLKDYKCKAFPETIPDEILINEFIHIKKHPQQINDILFEEIED